MRRTTTTTHDHAFDEFWAVYPRHDGKLAAKRKWDRLKLVPEVIAQILAALEWQRQLPGWQDIEFIPHAATYLHNARWEDDPPRRLNGKGHVPEFTEWSCPHIEEHLSRWRCDQATQLNKPRKVPA